MKELHDVALVDVPVGRFLQMQQQHDAMMREFTLIALAAEPDEALVPRRLVALAEEMYAGYGDVGGVFREGVAEAAARGDDITTLRLKIPYTTLRWTEDFLLLFEEGDEYCRRGHLLTPPSPPEVVACRRWLVGELIRQIRDGASPSPFWS